MPAVGSESEINAIVDIRKKLISEGYMTGDAETYEIDDEKGERKEYGDLHETINGAIYLDELKDKLKKKSIRQHIPGIVVGVILTLAGVFINELPRILFPKDPVNQIFYVESACDSAATDNKDIKKINSVTFKPIPTKGAASPVTISNKSVKQTD